MKLVRIIQNVSIPGLPGFRKGQQVRVSDSLGALLCSRGHAILEKGKSESEVKAGKSTSKPEVKSGKTTSKK